MPKLHPPWTKADCEHCGEQFYITRTQDGPMPEEPLCEECESYARGYKAGLRDGKEQAK